AGVGVVPPAPSRAARVDPVSGRARRATVVGRGRRQICAVVAMQANLAEARAKPVAPVPPDLVAREPGPTQEVANGEVLDAHSIRVVDQDPVAAEAGASRTSSAEVLPRALRAARSTTSRTSAVDDHRIAIHAPEMDPRRGNHHSGGALRRA